jgi:ATP phosphoribosyltransferase-like protein
VILDDLMLHIAPDKVDELGSVFPGRAAPTVLPLAGAADLVAAHMVVDQADLWARLADPRAMGAAGHRALPTDAIVD